MSRWHARLAELRASRNEAIPAVQNVQNVQNSPIVLSFEHSEQFEQRKEAARPPLADADEHAAKVDHGGAAPREWAEALARLDPNEPPADVPPQRWARFIGDAGKFLDGRWAERAAALGWGPLDLSAAIESGRSLASITWDCFGLSTVAPWSNCTAIRRRRRHTGHLRRFRAPLYRRQDVPQPSCRAAAAGWASSRTRVKGGLTARHAQGDREVPAPDLPGDRGRSTAGEDRQAVHAQGFR
jgi:hypothetical protein